MPMTVRAVWNGVVLAESNDTVIVDGNHYFPASAVRRECFTRSSTRSFCPWKGIASYYLVTVSGATNVDSAWSYRHPLPLARKLKNRVAFGNGVGIIASGPMLHVERSRARTSGSIVRSVQATGL
jgi:uncharacterized protein (DUF427 family)